MLQIQRSHSGRLEIRAYCQSCGDEIVNPGAGMVGYRITGDVKPVLLHQGCARTWVRQRHSGGNRRTIPAATLFAQLQD